MNALHFPYYINTLSFISFQAISIQMKLFLPSVCDEPQIIKVAHGRNIRTYR